MLKFQRKEMRAACAKPGVVIPVLECGGLAVHRPLSEGIDFVLSKRDWKISHFASGMGMSGYISTRKVAKEAILKILALNTVDWTQPADTLNPILEDRRILDSVKRILQEAERS